jgi:hypothetical protein
MSKCKYTCLKCTHTEVIETTKEDHQEVRVCPMCYGALVDKWHISKYPPLAKGGITYGPMLAMVGDNPGGQEVVAPLDKLEELLASAVGTAVMQAMQTGGNNNGPVNKLDKDVTDIDIKPLLTMKILTINEVREGFGLKPIPNGNELYTGS